MSERDTNSDSGSSPYDESTGRFPAVDPDARRPDQVPDRDSFFDRHNRGRSGLSRVEDLHDIDPDEVETSALPVPPRRPVPPPTPALTPTPTPATTPIPAASARTQAYSAVDEDELPTTAFTGPATLDPALPDPGLPDPARPDPALPTAALASTAAIEAGDPNPIRRRRRGGDGADRVEDDGYDDAPARRGTLDVGLLLLRVTVGAIAVAHGMQKVFGWWNGPGLDGFETFLLNSQNTSVGFAPDAAKPLAVVGALSETIGGLLLILGLATPLAASAVLGVMIVATTFKATTAGGIWFFATGQAGPGIEYEVLLAICAAAIILTGPGRISLDAPRGWARRPSWGSVLILVVAIAIAVAIWVVFNGSNPLDLVGNPVR